MMDETRYILSEPERTQLLLSRDEERRYEFIERMRRDYWDFEPMIRHHLREVLE